MKVFIDSIFFREDHKNSLKMRQELIRKYFNQGLLDTVIKEKIE